MLNEPPEPAEEGPAPTALWSPFWPAGLDVVRQTRNTAGQRAALQPGWGGSFKSSTELKAAREQRKNKPIEVLALHIPKVPCETQLLVQVHTRTDKPLTRFHSGVLKGAKKSMMCFLSASNAGLNIMGWRINSSVFSPVLPVRHQHPSVSHKTLCIFLLPPSHSAEPDSALPQIRQPHAVMQFMVPTSC